MKICLPLPLRRALLAALCLSLPALGTLATATLGALALSSSALAAGEDGNPYYDQASNTLYANSNSITIGTAESGGYQYSYEGGSTTEVSATGLNITAGPEIGKLPTAATTITITGGSYGNISFTRNSDGPVSGTLGTADAPLDLNLNISGDTSISTFGEKLGLLGYSGQKAGNVTIYGNIGVSINGNEGSQFGGLSLTGQSNYEKAITVNGNIQADILTGTYGLCDGGTNSLTSGLKGPAINGNITFNLGKEGTNGPSFEGYVVGGPATVTGALGSVKGDITLNINSGTYNGIAGNGHGSLTGNVTLNLNGGTYNGDIIGSLATSGSHTGSYTVNYHGGSFGATGIIRNTKGSSFSEGSNLNVYGRLATKNAEIQYFGSSTVKEGGTLTIDTTIDSYAKTLSVENGGSLSLATGGSLVVADKGSLSFAEGSTLTLSGENALSLSIGSSLSIGGLTNINVQSFATEGNTYTLISWAEGTTITGLDDSTLGNLNFILGQDLIGTGSIVNNSLQVTVSRDLGVYWVSGGNNIWSDGASSNFANSSGGAAGSATFENGTNVKFSAGQSNPILQGELVVGTLTLLDNAEVALTVEAGQKASLTANNISLGSGATLSKEGAGELAVSQNILSQAFSLNEGTLSLTAALSGSADFSQLSAADGTTLAVSGGEGSDNSLTLGNGFKGGLHLTGGTLSTAYAQDRRYNIDSGATLKLSGYDNSLAATLSGSGTVALELNGTDGGSNLKLDTWSGTIELSGSAGNLDLSQFGNANSTIDLNGLSSSIATSSIASDLVLSGSGWTLGNLGSDTELSLSGSLSGSGALSVDTGTHNLQLKLSGDTTGYSGAISNSGSGTLTLAVTNSGDTKLAGTLSGNIALSKQGSGTLTLTQGGNYSGGVSITGGTLISQSNGALGTGNVSVATDCTLQIVGAQSIGGDLTLGNGATLVLGGVGDSALSISGNLSGSNYVLDATGLTLQPGTSSIVLRVNGSIESTDTGTITLKAPDSGYSLVWNNKGQLVLVGDSSQANPLSRSATSHNGITGGTLIDQAEAALNPAVNDPDGELAAVITSLREQLADGDLSGLDRNLAAISGASATGMGIALSGDLRRQLNGIRNRMSNMGVSDQYINPDMPYFNAWINAEANFRTLDADGTNSGYEYNSWGGTVGADVDINTSLTCGLAFTAMYGDYSSRSSDSADGDLDTWYLTAFARYSSSAWTHSLIATFGIADTSLTRHVTIGGKTYTMSGDTDGYGLGLMYEVGYTIPMNEEGSTCLQPIFNISYTHSTLDAYSESGSDLALRFGDQSINTLTLGVGLRAQTLIGENVYNRSSLLEGRLLATFDVGDRRSSTAAGLALLPGSAGNIHSAELSVCGFEAGVGLSVPLGQNSGNLFIDGSVELRSDYSNLNATVGWRINF